MTLTLLPVEWSDPDRPAKLFEAGDLVVVLTDEGCLRRGRRMWHPGRSTGTIVRKHKLHERCWHVRLHKDGNAFEVLLFDDELVKYEPPALEETAA